MSPGPFASHNCLMKEWVVHTSQELLVANIGNSGDLTVRSALPATLAVLGSLLVEGVLRIDAPGLAVEILAVGDIEIGQLNIDAASILIHSVYGTLTLNDNAAMDLLCNGAPGKHAQLLLEASNGVQVAGLRSDNESNEPRKGCPLTRTPEVWAASEFIGERQQ